MYNENKRSGFAIASMICGICSLLTACCIGPIAIILGALSILFALLPYRRGEKRDSFSTTGIAVSCIGMALGVATTIMSCVSIVQSLKDPAFRSQLDTMYEEIYGEDFAEYWENNYGIHFD